jgi:two-component system, NarL family, sensor kinase
MLGVDMDDGCAALGLDPDSIAEAETNRSLLSRAGSAAHAAPQDFLHDEQRVQKVMDGLTEQVALVDSQWRILAVNEGWERLAAAGSYDSLRLHGNYRDFARQRAAEGKNGAAPVLSALAEFDAGERSHFRHRYAASAPWAGRIYLITIDRFESRGERFATIIRTDVTELEELRRQHRRRGSRLLRAQEDERRRIGRDLHDSTAQLLIGLQLGLARLRQGPSAPEATAAFSDLEDILDSVQREIRAVSFICHPPSLQHGGVAQALKSMTEGFARRTGLRIESTCDDVGDVSASMEATLYRFSQEALANIYRHAKATTVRLRLIARRRCLHLIIGDDGTGLELSSDRPWSAGVGILGMKERVREMGGRLSTYHAYSGTLLVASIPRRKRSTSG